MRKVQKVKIFIDNKIFLLMKKEILFHDETLFMNQEVFDFDFVPEEFMFRQEQMQELIGCINPAIKKKRPVNCILSGDPATGKTTSLKKIFEELKEYPHIITVYLNSRVHNTTFRVYSEINRKLFGYIPPESGIPVTSLYQKIFEKIKQENKILLIALDDCVFLEDPDEVIYQLSRANEIYPGVKVGILAVLSEKEKYIIEDKSASVFRPRIIEYAKYEEEEIFEILKIRAKTGFYPGVVNEDILRSIANYAIEQDLRFAIELLRQSAIEAESKSEKEILEVHLEKAFSGMLKKIRPGKEIDLKEKVILEILNNKKYNSGELYKLANKSLKLSYSSFYRIIEKLEKKKLICLDEKATNKGRTRIISKS